MQMQIWIKTKKQGVSKKNQTKWPPIVLLQLKMDTWHAVLPLTPICKYKRKYKCQYKYKLLQILNTKLSFVHWKESGWQCYYHPLQKLYCCGNSLDFFLQLVLWLSTNRMIALLHFISLGNHSNKLAFNMFCIVYRWLPLIFVPDIWRKKIKVLPAEKRERDHCWAPWFPHFWSRYLK